MTEKIKKIALAILGGTDLVVSMFIPLAVSLMIVTLYDLTSFSSSVIIATGFISALYRAIRIAIE